MQNLSQSNNPNFEFCNNIPFNYPLIYSPQLFPNCFSLGFNPYAGVTFLPNASLLSAINSQR